MPHQVEGVDYSVEGINDIRNQLIRLRNEALNQAEFTWAIIVSHAIAQLAYLVELEGGELENNQYSTESDFVSKLYARLREDSPAPRDVISGQFPDGEPRT